MIYHSTLYYNDGGWNGSREVDLKYWKNKSNAYKAIAKNFAKYEYDEFPMTYLQKTTGEFIDNVPKDYTFQMLVNDIANGNIARVTIRHTDYYFNVDEIKTED